MRFNTAFVAFSSIIMLGACSGKSDTTLASDSSLGRDLAMAATDSLAQPKLEDVPTPAPAAAPVTRAPATTTPRRPTPRPPVSRPSTPAPSSTTGTLSAGTTMQFATGSKVCSNTTSVGDKFTAPLSSSLSGSNGLEIPAGSMGTFEVTQSKTAKNSNDTTFLSVRLLSVSVDGRSYPVEAVVQSASTTRVRSASTSTDAKKVGGGAVIGAIVGQVIGKNTKGTIIGAAAGAAAGTAAAQATADYDTCLNSGSAISVRLSAPATVRIGG